MKKNELINKTLAGLMIAAMTAGVCPTTAFAVTGDQVAKDGTYTATAHVTDEKEEEWAEYDVTVSLEVKDGKFANVTVTPSDSYDASESEQYFNWAVSGRTKKNGTVLKGINSLVGQSATADTIGTWDAVSGATCTSNGIKTAATAALGKAEEAATPVEVNTANLEAAIAKAGALTETDYTAESWAKLQTALTAASALLSSRSWRLPARSFLLLR